jgi:nitroreductase
MNETLKTIRHLRSIRSFTDRPVKQEDLEAVLEASIRAANSSGRQCYSIIVLKDPAKMQAVCGYQGAAVLVYCVDYNRMTDIAAYLGEVNAVSTTIDFITGSSDTVLAAQTAVIAAKSLGIDSLVTNGVHRQDFKKLYELLELPSEYIFPLVAVVLGYSEVPEDQVKGRMKSGVIHYDAYHRMTPEEIEAEIEEFDTRDKKHGLIDRAHWEAAGFSHYYNWFFQKWIGPQEDRFSSVLREVKFLN